MVRLIYLHGPVTLHIFASLNKQTTNKQQHEKTELQ